jgi:hypothetical protein
MVRSKLSEKKAGINYFEIPDNRILLKSNLKQFNDLPFENNFIRLKANKK